MLKDTFTTNLALSLDVCTLSSLLNNNVTSGETPSKRVFDNQAVYWRCKIFTHILSMQGLSGQGELWKAFFNKSKINCPFIILYRMIDCLYRINFKTRGQKLQIRYNLHLQCRQCVCTWGKYLCFNQYNYALSSCIKMFLLMNKFNITIHCANSHSKKINPLKYQVANQYMYNYIACIHTLNFITVEFVIIYK